MDGMGMGGGRRRKVDNDKYYEILVSLHSPRTPSKQPFSRFASQLSQLLTFYIPIPFVYSYLHRVYQKTLNPTLSRRPTGNSP